MTTTKPVFTRSIYVTPKQRNPKFKGGALHYVVYIEERYTRGNEFQGISSCRDIGRFYYDSDKDRYRADEQMVEFLKADVVACVLWRYPSDAKVCLVEMASQVVKTWDNLVPFVIDTWLIQPSKAHEHAQK